MAVRTRETGWATPKGDGRRAAILEALRESLEDRPLAEISVAELTRRAGVTRSAFYFYFPSTSAAVAALLTAEQATMFALAHDWYAGENGTPEERLRAGMRASIDEWRGNPRWFAAMLDAAASDPDTGRLWKGFVDAFIARVADVIERDAGGKPSGQALATALVAMTFALMERDVRSLIATGEGVPELEDVLVHTWLTAIYGGDHGN